MFTDKNKTKNCFIVHTGTLRQFFKNYELMSYKIILVRFKKAKAYI